MTAPSAPGRVALVPGVLALLPTYAGLVDPVPDLRAACLAAVAWLGADVEVVGDEQGSRVGRHLVEAARPGVVATDAPAWLVVGNGSACRTQQAPVRFDARSDAFDVGLGQRLRDGLLDPGGPEQVVLADKLKAAVGGLVTAASELDRLGRRCRTVAVDFDASPWGVQYWVMRWTCES